MKFLLTGTRAYGPLTEESDWDIVMLRDDAIDLKSLLLILGIQVRDSNHIHPSYEGYYFKFNHIDKVQIIVAYNEIEFQAWSKATEEMKKIENIMDRADRIMTFQRYFYNALSSIRERKDKLF